MKITAIDIITDELYTHFENRPRPAKWSIELDNDDGVIVFYDHNCLSRLRVITLDDGVCVYKRINPLRQHRWIEIGLISYEDPNMIAELEAIIDLNSYS